MKEINANKNYLVLKNIDSIKIFSRKEKITNKLKEKQTRKIVSNWNNSEIFDYRDVPYDSIFYPDFNYKLFCISKWNFY